MGQRYYYGLHSVRRQLRLAFCVSRVYTLEKLAFIFMSKIQIFGSIFGLVIVIVAGLLWYLDVQEGRQLSAGNVSSVFKLYESLDVKFRDCGNEELVYGDGYNASMRECFKEAYNECRLVKLHQKTLTIEGDPIFTTAVVEGERTRGCAVHVYIDSRDRFGQSGISDTVCYSTILDSSSGQKSLFFDICEDGTQRFLY